MVAIQRRFLWAGSSDSNTVAWVRWSQVCNPMDKGGLGIKSIYGFNIALLSKWLMRFIREPAAIWKNLIKFRYNNLVKHILLNSDSFTACVNSLWWKDVCILTYIHDDTGSLGKMACKLGNGNLISFWHAKWVTNKPLRSVFLVVYIASEAKFGVVSDMGSWYEGGWRWNLSGGLVDHDSKVQGKLIDLLEILADISPFPDSFDHFIWPRASITPFSVKS
ncbi:unnamed protein product [Lathyrus sativus]|nr:unnamed protein product [Lathyrus sativus]